MVIKILQVTKDNQFIEVSVETRVGDTISSAVLWNDEIFKDYSKAVNLDSYLQKTNNKEVFRIPISSLSIKTKGKIFFLEFTSTNNVNPEECESCSNNIIMGVTVDLTPYKEFILDKILNLHYDKDCVTSIQERNRIINLDMILTALCNSIQFGYYNEAISLLKDLNKLTINQIGCDSCNSLPDAVVKTSLSFGILNNNVILV